MNNFKDLKSKLDNAIKNNNYTEIAELSTKLSELKNPKNKIVKKRIVKNSRQFNKISRKNIIKKPKILNKNINMNISNKVNKNSVISNSSDNLNRVNTNSANINPVNSNNLNSNKNIFQKPDIPKDSKLGNKQFEYDKQFLWKAPEIVLQKMVCLVIQQIGSDNYNKEKYGSYDDYLKWDKSKIISWLGQFDMKLSA